MGDLQKGERSVVLLLYMLALRLTSLYSQCNMDYIFASSVISIGLRYLKVSYDVCCQWFTHFWRRHQLLPPHLRLTTDRSAVLPLIPKFHLQSHTDSCHSKFSFNYCQGCGRTDGEGVERNWDELNGLAASTAEMTPAHRWETLDYACGWCNFRKTMGLRTYLQTYSLQTVVDSQAGDLLVKRLLIAITQAKQSRQDFRNFDTSLRAEIPDEVKEMEAAVAAWEADHSKPDPYLMPKSSEYFLNIIYLRH